MFSVIFAIIFGLIALGALAAYRRTRDSRDSVPLGIPVALGIVSALLLAYSCTAVVTASVGVPVTLGKVGEPMLPGLHAKTPITKVETYPIRNSDRINLGGDDGITVKTSEQGQLSVKPSLSYKIDPERAADIYLVARDADKLRDSIVEPYAEQAVVTVFSKLTNDQATATEIANLPEKVRTAVETELEKHGVEVVTLTMSAPRPSEKLQGVIDAKIAAEQDQKRSAIENTTREKRAESIATANETIKSSSTSETLCQQFIDVLREKGNIGTVLADPCSSGTKPGVIVQAPQS